MGVIRKTIQRLSCYCQTDAGGEVGGYEENYTKTTLWSDYRISLPGQFIRIHLKIDQKCRLFWDIFSSAIMNDSFMTFTSRFKMDAKCVYQQ